MSDLRELDEAIARARGWVQRKRTGGILLPGDAWIAPSMEEAWAARGGLMECNGVTVHGFVSTNPPPFSSSWALAGPLLEEMAESGRLEGDEAGVVSVGCPMRWCAAPSGIGTATEVSDFQPRDEAVYAHDGGGPCEAIARAWLAWHRSKA